LRTKGQSHSSRLTISCHTKLSLGAGTWFGWVRISICDEAGESPSWLASGTVPLLVHVSDMLGVARKRKLIEVMPEIDWIKIPPSEFDFLDFDDAEKLIAAAEGEWRTLILVAMRTGVRMGELIGLRWVDVDLSAGRINVRQNIVRGIAGLPKSGKPREIPLCDDAIEALAAHRHQRGSLVFCDAEGKALTSGLLAWPLKRAGLREIGWHVLRHTFASHLAMRGVPW